MSGEKTSFEEANGCAAGISGRIGCWNADAEARLTGAMLEIGKWVEKEAGAMLGHIKAAVTLDDGTGVTYNLTDMSNGVEKHGNLDPQEKVNFTFMSAVLDVDEHELQHRMYHAVDDSGLFYEIDEHVECHCHDHDHHHHEHDGECCCGHDHEHEHHHHHDHDEECHCHDHEHHHHDHDEECCCGHEHHHEHEHHHHHHDDDDEDECCCGHDHEHEHHHHHHDGEECHCHHHHDDE